MGADNKMSLTKEKEIAIYAEWKALQRDPILEEHNLLLTDALACQEVEDTSDFPKVIKDLQEEISKIKMEHIEENYPIIYSYLNKE